MPELNEKPVRVALTTLGCKINQYESAALREMFVGGGFEVVPFDAEADVYVINTCTVTARTDAESRRLIRRARRRNATARVVVTGCYAQVSPGEVSAVEGVDLVVGNAEKRRLPELLLAHEGTRVVVGDVDADAGMPLPLESHAEHTRAFLQIQNGCDSYCSYCIVPYARGGSRSVGVSDVLDAVSRFAERGFAEVVLTGIHLGVYGNDLEPRTDLAAIIRLIEGRGGVRRLRLGSVEPLEVTDSLIAAMAASRIVCPHLHVPLQSGDDAVLQRMNRGYDSNLFRERIEALAAEIPDICIGSDLIAGFPGETEEQFSSTVRFVESLPLAYLHVFPFSLRPGTAAAGFSDRLPPAVVSRRAETLRRVAEGKRRDYYSRFIGKRVQVLVQGEGAEVRGLSRNYLPVALAGKTLASGSEVEALIISSDADRCRGVVDGEVG